MKKVTVKSNHSFKGAVSLTFSVVPTSGPQPWSVYACDIATRFKVPVEIWDGGTLSLTIRP